MHKTTTFNYQRLNGSDNTGFTISFLRIKTHAMTLTMKIKTWFFAYNKPSKDDCKHTKSGCKRIILCTIYSSPQKCKTDRSTVHFLLGVIITKVFIKHKNLSVQTILSAYMHTAFTGVHTQRLLHHTQAYSYTKLNLRKTLKQNDC